MVSPPIDLGDLEQLPDHTEQLEKLNDNPNVDGILPRHLGNQELGRFVPGFTLIAGRTVQFHCIDESKGSLSFEKIYEFTAEQDVEVWDSLWEGDVVFHWADHEQALTLRGYELAYIGRFTLGRPIPDFEDMTKWAKEHLTITNPPEITDCDHEGEQTDQDTVERLSLVISECNKCGMPIYVEYDSTTVGQWETFLEEPWWEFDHSTVLEREELLFIDKRSGTSNTLTDVAVHLLSREAHSEYTALDHYLGDYNVVAVIFDGDFAGYLTWSLVEGRTVLQSIYIRPMYRGEDLARRLLETWHVQICPSKRYYASEPNDGGFAVLKSLDHIGNDIAAPIRLHSASDIVEPSKVAAGQN